MVIYTIAQNNKHTPIIILVYIVLWDENKLPTEKSNIINLSRDDDANYQNSRIGMWIQVYNMSSNCLQSVSNIDSMWIFYI